MHCKERETKKVEGMKSIERFIEVQAFTQWYDSPPRPPNPPTPEKKSQLLTGEGDRGGRGAESYDRKKAWSSINHKC